MQDMTRSGYQYLGLLPYYTLSMFVNSKRSMEGWYLSNRVEEMSTEFVFLMKGELISKKREVHEGEF